jgi:hypothetical protein
MHNENPESALLALAKKPTVVVDNVTGTVDATDDVVMISLTVQHTVPAPDLTAAVRMRQRLKGRFHSSVVAGFDGEIVNGILATVDDCVAVAHLFSFGLGVAGGQFLADLL